jgi:hypothetical protein
VDDASQSITDKELAKRSGVSLATIHRLKKAGLIPFFQPGGKGCVLRFPPDALERHAARKDELAPKDEPASKDEHVPESRTTAIPAKALSGPRPKWKRPS